MATDWWKHGVIYQIYPRSFADSDGDGVGDIAGIVERLDHLQWLGVDAVWLSPITASPNTDWGYDVADYCAIQSDQGTLADADRLIGAAHARDIRVLLDLVPNHTSDQHPWFVDSRSSRAAQYRDWYVWADPKPDGGPPNNWVSSFGGAAWTLDGATGQYYLHNHLPTQPDLNWWNEDVRNAFDGILRFWFDRGVDGFRIDVCNVIVKDLLLRDNPPATEHDSAEARLFGQVSIYNANRPEVHDVLQRWRAIADAYEPRRVLVGETPVEDLARLVAFHGAGNELHLAFNFPFIVAPFEARPMRKIVEEMESLLPAEAWPAWTGSNHDMSRFATRWANDDAARARTALVMLLGLRGTPVLYQGDEIGLGDTPLDKDDLRDPLGVRYWPHYKGRDPMRTPMPWRNTPGGGFTRPESTPWLPLNDLAACNVEQQRDDAGSTLTLVRDLIALRRSTPDLERGSYASMPSPEDVWAWRRGDRHVVALNLSDRSTSVDVAGGRIVLGTDRARDGAAFTGSIHLGPWEGVIAELS